MEFSKLKKGISKFNKKGIKVALFTLALGAMIFGMMQFKDGDEVQAWSGWASYGDELYPPNGNIYDRSLATPISGCGLTASVLYSLDYDEYIVWLSGKLESSTTHSQLNEFIKSINPTERPSSDNWPLIYYVDADFSDTTDLSYMFSGVSRLKEVVFDDNVDTSSITNMSYMFHNCDNLESIYLGTKFNTSNVTDMSLMFCGPVGYMSKLEKITYSNNFVTTNVQNFNDMFNACNAITELDLSNFTFDNSMYSSADTLLKNSDGRTLMNLETVTIPKKKINLQYEWSTIALPTDRVWHLYDENWNRVSDDPITKLVSKEDYPSAKYLSTVIYIDEYGNKYFPSDIYNNGLLCKWNISQSGGDLYAYVLKKKDEDGEYVTGENFLLITGTAQDIKEFDNGSNAPDWLKNNAAYGTLNFKTAIVDKGCNPNSYECVFLNNPNLENVIFDVKAGEKKWVTSIRGAFSGCTKLKKLDFSNFDETKCLITKLDGAFAGCLSLTEIKGLENFDVSGATNFSQVFNSCISLEDFDISSWDMSSATDINQMLSNLNKLTELDLSSFEFNSIQDDYFSLTSGSNLERIYLPKSTNGKIITQQTSDDWYLYSGGVKGASVGDTIPARTNEGDYIQKESLVIIDGIKYYPSDLARYDDDGDIGTPQVQARWDISKDVPGSLWAYVFKTKKEDGSYVSSLNDHTLVIDGTGDIMDFNRVKYITGSKFFDGTDTSDVGPYSLQNWKTEAGGIVPWSWISSASKIKHAVITEGTNPSSYKFMFASLTGLEDVSFKVADGEKKSITNLDSAFYHAENLQSLDFSDFDNSNLTAIKFAFCECQKLTEIKGLNKLDVSSVTSFYDLFQNCYLLDNLEIEDWNTENVTNMSSVFYGCRAITDLDLNNWNTSKVTKFDNMFNDCSNIRFIKLNSWNVEAGEDFSYMFYNCPMLTDLDVSSWITTSAKNFNYMFEFCKSIFELDLSSWVVDGVENYEEMFAYSPKLETLDLSTWNMKDDAHIQWMLDGCTNLNCILVPVSCPQIALPDGQVYWFAGYDKEIVKKSYNCFSNYKVNDLIDTSTINYIIGKNQVSTVRYTTSNDITDKSKYNCLKRDFLLYTDTNGVEYYDKDLWGWGNSAEHSKWNISDTGKDDLWAMLFKRKDSSGNYLDGRFDCLLVLNGSYTKIFDFKRVYTNYANSNGFEFRDENGNNKYFSTAGYWANWREEGKEYVPWVRYFMVSSTSYYTNNCIKEAVVAKGCNPESYHMLFAYLPGLTTVRFECDTANDEIKNPKSIRSMFVGSSNIETIEFPSGVSFKDLEDASYAFSKCSKLNTVIFNNTTNAKLSSCVSMFDSSSKLSTITGIEDFDVSEVEEFTKMFQKCNALTNLDLSNWDVSNAKNFDYMFYQCSELTSLNIDEWNTRSGERFYYMFDSCNKLKEDFSDWNVSSGKCFERMFNGCKLLDDDDLNLSNWDVSNATTFSYMFAGCEALTQMDLHKWNPENLLYLTRMFSNCTNLVSVNLKGWDFPDNPDYDMSFDSMFYNDAKLKNVDLSNWKISKADSFAAMFEYCSSLESLDLSSWNLHSGKRFNDMFYSCTNLKTLDVSTWVISNAYDFSSMFKNCKELTNLDLSSWGIVSIDDWSSEADLESMFEGCEKLITLDVSGWDMSYADELENTFTNCKALKELDLSSWKITKCSYFEETFSGCSSLEKLDLSSWKVPSWSNDDTFKECKSLKFIMIPEIVQIDESYPDDSAMIINYTDDGGNPARLKLALCNYNKENDKLTKLIVDGNKELDYLLGQDVDSSRITNIKGNPTSLAFNCMAIVGTGVFDEGIIAENNDESGDDNAFKTNDVIKIVIPFDGDIKLITSHDPSNDPKLKFVINGTGGSSISGEGTFVSLNEDDDTITFTYKVKSTDKIVGPATIKVTGITNYNEIESPDGKDLLNPNGLKNLPQLNINKPTGGGGGSSSGGGGASITIGTKPLDEKGLVIELHKAYMTGYTDKTFRPQAFITREEVATIVARLHTEFSEDFNFTSYNSFGDTDTRWSKNYIGFCKYKDLVHGYEDGSFKPSRNMTRAELAVLVNNFTRIQNANLDKVDLSKPVFSDVDGRWYEKDVNTLASLGILNGYEDGTFRGDNFVTRIEVAIVMNKLNGRTVSGDIDKEYKERVTSTYKDVTPDRWFFKDVAEAGIDHPANLY